MILKLIDGDFSQTETNDLLTQLFQVKIKFLEDKVKNSSNEEDIKMRELKIKFLQNTLADARAYVKSSPNKLYIKSEINL
jgi:hypothetical protein